MYQDVSNGDSISARVEWFDGYLCATISFVPLLGVIDPCKTQIIPNTFCIPLVLFS